jgi:hypothetical protein
MATALAGSWAFAAETGTAEPTDWVQPNIGMSKIIKQAVRFNVVPVSMGCVSCIGFLFGKNYTNRRGT